MCTKGFSSTQTNKHTFPVKPKFRGTSSVDCSINFICNGDGVQVVARVPVAGPVPPPTMVVIPAYIMKVLEFFRGQMSEL